MRAPALIAAWCTALVALTQDARLALPQHAMPLLSPGSVGANDAPRAALLHGARRSGQVRFGVDALQYDAPIRRAGKAQRRSFALGVVLRDERTGAPRMRSSQVAGAIAYHVKAGAHSTFGGGLQLGLLQHYADAGEAAWASQYNGLAYDPSLPSGESFGMRPRTVPDAAAGLHYGYTREGSGRESRSGVRLNAGFAVQHLPRPRLFVEEGSERIARRYLAFIYASLGDPRGRRSLEPAVLVQEQGARAGAYAGTTMMLSIAPHRSFTGPDRAWSVGLGAHGRTEGSGIASMHLRWGEFAMALAYEVPFTAAQRNLLGDGTAELVLRYEARAAKR